jgi:hypothetical protein
MPFSNSQYRAWNFQIWDCQRNKEVTDDSAQLLVLTAGSPTAPTIYSSADGTTVSNAVRTPRTSVKGWFKFWTPKSVSSVDLVLMTSKGEAYFYEDVSYNVGRLNIDPFNRNHVLVLPFGASDNTEVDTGLDLPVANLVVKDAHLVVTTVDATETIEVGILASESGGDADGFIDAVSVATAGYVNMFPVVTGGTNIDYLDHTVGYGVFLKQGIAGADAVATVGGWAKRHYRTDGTAKSISYTGSSGSDTAAGYIYLDYLRMPSA